jgi:hypothetical protein
LNTRTRPLWKKFSTRYARPSWTTIPGEPNVSPSPGLIRLWGPNVVNAVSKGLSSFGIVFVHDCASQDEFVRGLELEPCRGTHRHRGDGDGVVRDLHRLSRLGDAEEGDGDDETRRVSIHLLETQAGLHSLHGLGEGEFGEHLHRDSGRSRLGGDAGRDHAGGFVREDSGAPPWPTTRNVTLDGGLPRPGRLR